MIFIPDHHKSVAILVSSGKDSAYLLYATCEYLRENKRAEQVKIIVAHLIDLVRVPYSEKDLDVILDKFKERYPEITFEKITHSFVETNNKSKEHNGRLFMTKLIKDYGVETMFGGITQNLPPEMHDKVAEIYGSEPPPTLVQRQAGTDKSKIKIFDHEFNFTDDIDNCRLYKVNPIFEENSYTIYQKYKKSKFLSEEIFPLTRSCVGGLFDTGGWKMPCKKCWWCCEKKTIFGGYDGEQIG